MIFVESSSCLFCLYIGLFGREFTVFFVWEKRANKTVIWMAYL